MIDKPERTRKLLATLRAALPFEIGLARDALAVLARQQKPVVVGPTESVSDISYAGDEGGILCHIQPNDSVSMIVVSLTHVRVPLTLPFAAAVLDYQKHRVRRLRPIMES